MTSQPLDENATALAQIALTAAKALNDATEPNVGYPGLTYPDDVAQVLDALARLAGGLQATVAHLGRFMAEELDAGRLTSTGDGTGAAEVSATRARLQEAHAASGELSAQLDRAAAAVSRTISAKPT